MDKFWEFLRSSALVQGLMGLSTLSVILYMYVTGSNVPTELVGIVTLILGFYFGSKTQQRMIREEKQSENNFNKHSDRQRQS